MAREVRKVQRTPILHRVDTGYACFGVEEGVFTGLVVKAAPIAGWAIGKSAFYVLNYYVRKGATTMKLLSPGRWIDSTGIYASRKH